ncbi:MAG: phosphoribosylglycinamide formyltransferase [Paracoccaceae bacterium]|nr:phosphoribosylglycinamide formyltransferase [Paracoccaceae bacterium]
MKKAPKRVAVLISGGGSNMIELCHSMVGDHPARPVLVLSNRPLVGGLKKAAAMGIPIQTIDHQALSANRAAFEAELARILQEYAADIICLAGFMRILSPSFVQLFHGCMLNIHPSLLPKYPGLNTHARALAAGDRQAGCSVHLVTPELDKGPILGQESVPILPHDTSDSLAARVLVAEHQLYPRVLRSFAEGPLACL